jgi:tripartite-type tricarboxylate transporter receptor subunit TctC
MNTKLTALLSSLVAALVVSPAACGQSYPSKPIRFIVQYPPGGGTDLFARLLASALTESLGQQVLVDNRAGAQGSIGLSLAAKSPPDGYTIALTEAGSVTMNPWLYANAGFDPVKDFSHISLGVTYPNVLVTNLGVPVKNLKELAALAKSKPGALTYASASALSQLTGALFQIVANVKMLEVPYKGAGPAAIDVAGGQVDMTFVTSASAIPMINAGKTRALVVTGPERLSALPNVPTSKESGFPAFVVLGWFGVATPANTPKDIIAKLNREIVAALKTPSIISKLQGAGLDPKSSSPEEMTEIVKADYVRWGKVVKTVGIKVQ